MRPIIGPLLVALLAGCVHDVRATFPAEPTTVPPGPTGTLVLRFTGDAHDVAVTLDGQLVVADANTTCITITDVPTGPVDLVVAAGSGEKALQVWIAEGRTTTVPLGSSDEGALGPLRGALVSLASVVLYALLN